MRDFKRYVFLVFNLATLFCTKSMVIAGDYGHGRPWPTMLVDEQCRHGMATKYGKWCNWFDFVRLRNSTCPAWLVIIAVRHTFLNYNFGWPNHFCMCVFDFCSIFVCDVKVHFVACVIVVVVQCTSQFGYLANFCLSKCHMCVVYVCRAVRGASVCVSACVCNKNHSRCRGESRMGHYYLVCTRIGIAQQ